MQRTIQIADKETLDSIAADIAEIKKNMQDDSTGSDIKHAVWLNDYKTYGTDSYVYNNKDIWNELCCSPEGINDKDFNHNCLNYLITSTDLNAKNVLSGLYDINANFTSDINETSLADLFNSSDAMKYLMSSQLFLDAILGSNSAVLAKYNVCNIDKVTSIKSDCIASIFSNSILIVPFVRDIASFKKCYPLINSIKSYQALYNALSNASYATTKAMFSYNAGMVSSAVMSQVSKQFIVYINTTYKNTFDGADKLRLYYGGTSTYDLYTNPTTTSGSPINSKVMKQYSGPTYITTNSSSSSYSTSDKVKCVYIDVSDVA